METTQGKAGGMDAKIVAMAIALLVQLGGIVWWASNLQSSVQHNNYQIQMMQAVVVLLVKHLKHIV